MLAASLDPDELAALPVFPLPHVVFFPGTALPLHLFEPRYRQMIDHCMVHGPQALAVALLDEGWEDDYEGQPQFRRIAGAGRIAAHQKRDDGTHDIILVGTGRVQLEELSMPNILYRRAAATPLQDTGTAEAAEVTAMLACAQRVAVQVKRQQPDFELRTASDASPGRLADMICDQLVSEPQLRQLVLETIDVGERVKVVTDAVAELMARLSDAPPS